MIEVFLLELALYWFTLLHHSSLCCIGSQIPFFPQKLHRTEGVNGPFPVVFNAYFCSVSLVMPFTNDPCVELPKIAAQLIQRHHYQHSHNSPKLLLLFSQNWEPTGSYNIWLFLLYVVRAALYWWNKGNLLSFLSNDICWFCLCLLHLWQLHFNVVIPFEGK